MNKEEFNQKMNKVSSILNLTWILQPAFSDNTGEMNGPDDVCIWTRSGGYSEKGKIRINSVYPRDGRGQNHSYQKDISIRISETKTPEQIAKDIQKRFLPTYLNNLQQVRADIVRQNKYYQDKENNIKMIAAHFGWEPRNDCSSIYTDIFEIYHIKARDDKEVEFKVTCSPEIAIKIIELLKKRV